jgi:plastocyanin
VARPRAKPSEEERRPQHRCRDVYLKIEKLPAYSPVAPDDAEHHRYRLDCMRNQGHEDATIPNSEVERRRLDALVYREYLDHAYTTLNTAPLIAADANEPRPERRMPGAVIYSEPGERLFIHVLNGDDRPHSLHMHGLQYGIDSDGSWPFGVMSHDGRRSDEICPGEEWCYVFDATKDTIGAWPFHDHGMDLVAHVNRGLFGAVIVRDPKWRKVDHEVPFFFHRLTAPAVEPLFGSGIMDPGDPPFVATFPDEGTFEYFCELHPMRGTVRVTAAGAATEAVTILDAPGLPRFAPDEVTVRPGGTVTWTHGGAQPHTVTEAGGASLESYAFNGRTFVGNTPTIVARTGERIRWYVFNLDLGMLWHNFHAHGQRWQVGDEIVDTRSLGPAESFVAETVVPPVILPPIGCKHDHHGHGGDGHEHDDGDHDDGDHHGDNGDEHGHGNPGRGHGHDEHDSDEHDEDPRRPPGKDKDKDKDKDKGKRVRVRGDFLVHCHVEMHMMEGMAALVRALDDVELTEELERELCFEPPVDTGAECPEVHHDHCGLGGEGTWERLADSPIFIVHAAVLNTGKVLLWSGTAEVNDPLESRVWDPATETMTTQVYGEDLFCSGHAFLPDGRLCVSGGAPIGVLRSTHLFDPAAETWTKVADMAQARWYPTVLTLPDGRILAASGMGASGIEIYDPAANAWQTVAGANRTFSELYPSLNLLPSGQIFYSRAGWQQADLTQTQTAYLTLTGPLSGNWTSLGQQQFVDRQEGTAVLMIDGTVSPPATQLIVIGGGAYGPPTTRNPQSAERIDLTQLAPPPAWTRTEDMTFARTNVNAVLLPDGTVFVVGGQRNGKWNADPQPVLEAEIYDPSDDSWTVTAPMAFPRQYHSIAVLLPDGRVLTAGGVDPSPGIIERDQRSMEVFSPAYLSRGPRPVVAAVPANVAYGADFDVDSPDADDVDAVVFLRPCSVTHHTDAGQRYVKLEIRNRDPASLTVRAPANGNVAPPGYYMLFLVSATGVPSVARFVRIA